MNFFFENENEKIKRGDVSNLIYNSLYGNINEDEEKLADKLNIIPEYNNQEKKVIL